MQGFIHLWLWYLHVPNYHHHRFDLKIRLETMLFLFCAIYINWDSPVNIRPSILETVVGDAHLRSIATGVGLSGHGLQMPSLDEFG